MSSIASQFVRRGKKIVAIGRNYSEHIKELGNTRPKEPFFFLKPTTSYVSSGGDIELPRGILAHYEVELGLVIGKGGRDISPEAAESHIAGYALAIDMTARNMQEEVKKKGLPWSAVKGFDTFTPIGGFIPKSTILDPHDLRLLLKINGITKQNGTTADMIFRIPRLIEHISSIMTLEEGDLVLTGTPSGVGPVAPGDKVECTLADSNGKILDAINFTAVARSGGYLFKP
ncbi:hypothetical protein EDC04DRAFT_2777552 [Pisolithus marmoratus]|nr:hypothetical protein EDC04DRAFT_2777552 [Pisolithus marmoratus]